MAITIDPNTGETVQGGKSPRFVLWLTFFAFATIVMGSAISEVSTVPHSEYCTAQWIQLDASFFGGRRLILFVSSMISSFSFLMECHVTVIECQEGSFVYFSNRSLSDCFLTYVNPFFSTLSTTITWTWLRILYIRNKIAKEGKWIFFQCSMGGLLFVLFVCHSRGGHSDAPHSFPLPLRRRNQGRGSPYACFGHFLVRNGCRRCVCVSLGWIGFSSGRLCFCLPWIALVRVFPKVAGLSDPGAVCFVWRMKRLSHFLLYSFVIHSCKCVKWSGGWHEWGQHYKHNCEW